MTEAVFIDHPDAYATVLDAWRAAPWLCVDTEFVRVDTYYPQLCLVQVSDGTRSACIDVLKLDPAPLFALLARPEVGKIFHAAGQDLEIFVQKTGDCPRPVFDTQIAAALVGHGEQLGYAGLVEKRLGIAVDKSLARTDWSRRPLSPAAIEYAADDVRHLAQLYPALRDELVRRGRLAWLEEEGERLTRPERYRMHAGDAWQTVKGLGRLIGKDQQCAARLAAWREEEAQRRNRPRRWILDDEVLCRIAGRRPTTRAELAAIEGVTPKQVERVGDTLLALVNAPGQPDTPLLADLRYTPEQKQRIQILLEELRALAAREEVSATLIATRSDIETLVRDGAAARIGLLQGWRRALAGEALLQKSLLP